MENITEIETSSNVDHAIDETQELDKHMTFSTSKEYRNEYYRRYRLKKKNPDMQFPPMIKPPKQPKLNKTSDMKEYKRNYVSANKEKVAKHSKDHYANHKGRYTCDLCKYSCVNTSTLNKHFKSKTHIRNELKNKHLHINGSTPVLIMLSDIKPHYSFKSSEDGVGTELP